MFTLEQISAAHAKVKSGADFPNYIQDLILLGVKNYDTFVHDGHTDFYGNHDYQLTSPAKYDTLQVEEESHEEQFIRDLKNHQNGNTDYPTFCRDCAQAGVEKWTVDTTQMTCTYYDRLGKELLVECIPAP